MTWGPAFALLGVLIESVTPGPDRTLMWVLVGAGLLLCGALWAHGRRRLCSVRLTESTLSVGGEQLALSRIIELVDADGDVPVGSRVLGGGAIAPKGTGEVPLRLDDDRVVIAWAFDPDALTMALRARVG